MARKLGITPRDVLHEAATLADEHGLGGVTLAAVAERLGVRSPSLYAHVPQGLDGLRRELALHAADAMAKALGTAASRKRGLEALEAIAHAYRRFARRHPGWYAAAQRAVRPGEDDELYRRLAAVVQPALRALNDLGVPPQDQVHLARAFRAALHGFVTLETTGGFGRPEAIEESFTRLVATLLAGVRATTPDSQPPRR